MKRVVERFWFFVGIAAAFALAFRFPEWGGRVREARIVPVGVFLTFVITGATLDFGDLIRRGQHLRALVGATVSTLIVLPITIRALAGGVFRDQPDFLVGATLIAAAPVTVASGTIMTAMALGNVALSLSICVATNLACLLTMPALLPALLRMEQPIHLPAGQILSGLALTVVLPTLLGAALRKWIRPWLGGWTRPFSQSVVLLIIFNAAASSVARIRGAEIAALALLGFTVVLRFAIVGYHWLLSRALRLDGPSRAAFTIHASQKTLVVSSLVWGWHFAERFPMALLPGIAYHLVQMVMDTLVARGFRRAAIARGAQSG